MATDELAERIKASFARARDKLAVAKHVLAGRLPEELASTLRELKDERENGDYSIFPAITAEEAERAVASAERFVAALEEFLHDQGFATAD